MFRKMVFAFLVLLMAGCQGGQVLGKSVTPTLAEDIVAEGEINCPIENFREIPALARVEHPEQGETDAALVVFWDFTCPETYLKGSAVAIQDGYFLDDGTYHWTGLMEFVTDEGGIWKGTTDNNPSISRSISKGEGKYKGLQLVTEYDLTSFNLKFRVTKLAGE